MADEQARQGTDCVERITQQHRIRMSAPEATLPAVAAVMGFGQLIVQRFIVSWKWADAVAGEICAHDAIVLDRPGKAKSRGCVFDGSGCDGTPRGIRVESARFIEEHALRPFKQDAALLQLSADRVDGCGGTLPDQR